MNLQLIKSESFGEVQTDIYSDGTEMFMTIKQLSECLEYADKSGVEKILQRNEYLYSTEFSTTHKLSVVEGGREVNREMRIFTEDGIYEVTMLSGQPKAQLFRKWIRGILKGLRKGKLKVVPAKQTLSATNTAAKIIIKALESAGVKPQYIAVAVRDAYKPVGIDVPLDGITLESKFYDAATIAERLGILSKNNKPHAQAVSAIISELNIAESERQLVPFMNNGHSGTTYQYSDSVIEKVDQWIKECNYPTMIKVNGRNYMVTYSRK